MKAHSIYIQDIRHDPSYIEKCTCIASSPGSLFLPPPPPPPREPGDEAMYMYQTNPGCSSKGVIVSYLLAAWIEQRGAPCLQAAGRLLCRAWPHPEHYHLWESPCCPVAMPFLHYSTISLRNYTKFRLIRRRILWLLLDPTAMHALYRMQKALGRTHI